MKIKLRYKIHTEFDRKDHFLRNRSGSAKINLLKNQRVDTKCEILLHRYVLAKTVFFQNCGNATIKHTCFKCYGFGCGILCFFDTESGIRIRHVGKFRIWDEHPGSYFRELRNNSWARMLKFFDAELGWKKSDLGSGINIPDPQHCTF